MNAELNGRTVVLLPGSADGLRGPARTTAITNEARALADAITARLDCIDLFDDGGQLVLIAGGGLHNVNAQILREIIRTNFATKHIVMTGAGLAVEYRLVEVGELVIRTLLTAPPNQGGLVGRVPAMTMEPPRQVVEEAAAVVTNAAEDAAGRAALARHQQQGNERLREEIERGQQRLKELRNG
jgi:hypothetical protein